MQRSAISPISFTMTPAHPPPAASRGTTHRCRHPVGSVTLPFGNLPSLRAAKNSLHIARPLTTVTVIATPQVTPRTLGFSISTPPPAPILQTLVAADAEQHIALCAFRMSGERTTRVLSAIGFRFALTHHPPESRRPS